MLHTIIIFFLLQYLATLKFIVFLSLNTKLHKIQLLLILIFHVGIITIIKFK